MRSALDARLSLAGSPDASGAHRLLVLETEERLSTCFKLTLELASAAHAVLEPGAVLRKDVAVAAGRPGDPERHFHGVVTEVKRWTQGAGAWRGRHRLVVRPRLALLGHNQRIRFFQEMTTEEIVTSILQEGRVEHEWRVRGARPKRDYCVQYRESDLAFISRLLEEEGIFFYFRHEDGRHLLVLGDSDQAFEDVSARGPLPFVPAIGLEAAGDHAFELRAEASLQPDVVSLRDYNPLAPHLEMAFSAGEKTPAVGEVYAYPGRFDDVARGRHLAQVQLEALGARRLLISGSARCLPLGPGQVIRVTEAPAGLVPETLVLTATSHRMVFPREGIAARTDEDGAAEVAFEAQSSSVPFRAPLSTPRPSIGGTHTAVVTGPPGEEIYTDEHGRVKVKFHWDRTEIGDERTSCWVRVAQSWAGPGWGALYLPRIGQEVVVAFVEGDPDRPLVVGAVYNGQNPPPVMLPGDKTRSVQRSSSTPGGQGWNEIAFEDAAGREVLAVHAQRDLDVVVKNDRSLKVGGNETTTIDGSRQTTIGGAQTTIVQQADETTVILAQTVNVGGARTVAVGLDLTETVGGAAKCFVGGSLEERIGGDAVETVGESRTLSVAGDHTVTVGGELKEEITLDRQEAVGGNRIVQVTGDATTRVTGGHQVFVTGEAKETMDDLLIVKVEKEFSISANEARTETVGETYSIEAKDVLLDGKETVRIRVGSATLEIAKDGAITLEGKQLTLSSSGDLVLKGAKIMEN